MLIRKPQKNAIGLYWGKEGFYLVEVDDKIPKVSTAIPFDAPLGGSEGQPIPEDVKFAALLKKAKNSGPFSSEKVNLTISTKDFIFRSFDIPFMAPHEAKNVIEFEATKYIPIPLRDLQYSYHMIPCTDNGQRQLRILFFAARRDLLEHYANLITQAGFQAQHIEPEPLSLARVLRRLGLILKKQTIAVLIMGRGEGKILFLNDESILFVREFQLPNDSENLVELNTKLFNEIRVSFSFFSRQHTENPISKMIVLVSQAIPNLDKDLSGEFGKPVTMLTLANCVKGITTPFQEIGSLFAYGHAIRDRAPTGQDIELAEKIRQLQKTDEAARIRMREYLKIGAFVVGCSFVCLFAALLTNVIKAKNSQLLTNLRERGQSYEFSDTASLLKLTSENSEKLSAYQNIPIKSNVADLFRMIANILPSQAWLRTMNIIYQKKITPEGKEELRPNVILNGYVYLPEANEQFRFVVKMVDQLKKITAFSDSFESITLDSMGQESFKNLYIVTYFQITCR